jgi:signal transduction histidine kinase
LIYVINDLLDLTKAEEGQELFRDDVFDFSACIREATDPFQGDAKRKGIEYRVLQHPGLPQFVHGDQRRVRQAIANITANAMQHTTDGSVCVELSVAEQINRCVIIEIVVEDTGCGMSNKKLDALFRDLEQVSTDTERDFFNEEHDKKEMTGGSEKRTLGLGLAVRDLPSSLYLDKACP